MAAPFETECLGVDITDLCVTTHRDGATEIVVASAHAKLQCYRLGDADDDRVALQSEAALEEPASRFEMLGPNTMIMGGPSGTLAVFRESVGPDGARLDVQCAVRMKAHEAEVTGIAVADDGRRSYSVCDEGSLAAVDVVAERVVRRYEDADPVSLAAVAVRNLDGNLLTAGTAPRAQLKLWDLRSDAKSPAAAFRHPFSGAAYTSLSPHPSAPHEVLAGTSDGEVVWFDLRHGRGTADVVACLQAHDGDVLGLQHHPVTPRYFFSSGADGTLLLIEGAAGVSTCYAEKLGRCGAGLHAISVDATSNSVVGASRSGELVVVQGLEQTAAGSKYSFRTGSRAASAGQTVSFDDDLMAE